MSDEERLIEAALRVRENAYAPYSRFQVGAALRADDGRVYVGANVENAAYPEGICAEAAALGALVAGGGKRIVAVAVASAGPQPCSPCGGCRQKLAEFGAADVAVHMGTPDGARRTTTLGDLLPQSFGAADLAAPKD